MPSNLVRSLIVVILTTVSVCAWSGGKIYKCKNQQGALIYQKSSCDEQTETVNSWSKLTSGKAKVSPPETGKSNKEPSPVLKLKQNARGHYLTAGSINDKPLNFVVDTGATIVSLPEAVAHGALIYCDDNIGVMTANGAASACTAKIKNLRFGPFEIKDVPATIVPNLSQPLLGMNVLQAFKIAQEKGEMHLSIQQ